MWHIIGDYLFVHAGIVPHIPLDLQQPQNLLWIRSLFLNYKDFFEYYVVHGHSAIPAPDIKHNRANIDISVAMKESLCCLVAEGSERNTIVVT
jgi:serine/threonine protein phosphatase 1